MAYSPETDFNLISDSYTPSNDFVFGSLQNTVKTTFSLNVRVKNTVKTIFNMGLSVENTVKTTFNLTHNVKNTVQTTFNLVNLIGNSVQTTFNLVDLIGNSVQTTFSLNARIENTVKTTFNLTANVKNTVSTVFSLNAHIKTTVQTLFSLTPQIRNTVQTPFDLNAITLVKNTVTTVIDIAPVSTTAHLAMDATLTLDGQIVDILTANISQDEDSWTWAFNATIADHGNWVNVRPSNGSYPDVVLTVRGVSFNLMIEGMQRSRKAVNNTWSINGRGITARLDGKYASGVETEWRSANASTIIQELCAAASITLDYQDVDWPIPEIIGDGRYPIEIINEIAGAIGAVVQTSIDGTLTIRPRYEVKPADYATTTPDFTLTDADDYVSLDEKWLDRDNYNVISIGDGVEDEPLDDSGNAAQSALTIIAEDDLDSDGNRISDNKIIKIFSVPFIESITLDDSAEGALSLIYQGVFSETLELPAVEIVRGHGSLSDPSYAVLLSDYIHTDLGEITVEENGNITTEIKGQSLIGLSYSTKYHKYVAVRNSTDKYLQVWAEVEE